MTSSHYDVIRRAYGAQDTPYPILTCEVVFRARVLRYANDDGRYREVTDRILSEATEAADLVERLSEPVEYIDFAVHDGRQVLNLRMQYVERGNGVTLCIDFHHTPVMHIDRSVQIPHTADAPSSMTR